MSPRRQAVITAAVLAALLPAGAAAQSAPTPTLTALATATVKPVPADRNSDASIGAAVAAAKKKALPQAVANARARAAELAAAAGLTLGALQSISDSPAQGYPFFYDPQNGTFGNGHFCGNVRRFKTVTTKTGVRRRVALKGTRRVCRVPGTVNASVALTYAVTG